MKIDLPLSDERYFHLAIGDRTLIKDLRGLKGKIPAYSASVQKIYGYTDASNITDFSHDYVLWGIDWKFVFNIKHCGEQFATTDHCGTIAILDSGIVPEYLVNELEIRKHEMGFDRSLRASLTNMRRVVVSIPVTKEGRFDVARQKQLVDKYNLLKKTKSELEDETNVLKKAVLEVTYAGPQKTVNVTEILDFPAINSGITKKFCEKNKGPIPVFGGSGLEKTVGSIRDNINGIKYFENSLTWNRNGSIFNVNYRKERFTVNEDHRVAEVKEPYKTKLSLKYLRYALKDSIRKMGFAYNYKLSKGRFGTVFVSIPLDGSGEYDLLVQEQLAEKYERLYGMKDDFTDHLENLTSTVVQL